MSIFGGGYSGPTEVHYLFVDGASLHGRLANVAKKHFSDAELEIDFQMLKGRFTKVFYYDAVPVRNDNESEHDYEERIAPIQRVLDAAAATDGVHVYEGDARRRKRRGLEQKKVDVQLTVDMLTHSFRKNMHKATLLTGDNDFKPLVDAVVQDGMFVTLWYPVGETSDELLRAADARVKLSMIALHNLLTKESRTKFRIPSHMNKNPINPDIGPRIGTGWRQDGKECALHKTQRTSGAEFTVTREGNPMNMLNITHENLDFLCDFCFDSFDIEIPSPVLSQALA